MDELSRQEVAGKAGVDPDYVDRLVEFGILRPRMGDTLSRGDARRARWVQSLERAGVPLDGIAAAVRDGGLSFSFLDAAAFDRFPGLSGTTFRELSERTGVSFELLKVVREALGFAEPRPEDRVREDELSVVQAIDCSSRRGSGLSSSSGGFGSTGTVCAGSPRRKRPGTRLRWCAPCSKRA